MLLGDLFFGGITLIVVSFFAPILPWSSYFKRADIPILSGCMVVCGITGMIFKGLDGATTGRLDYQNDMCIYFVFTASFSAVLVVFAMYRKDMTMKTTIQAWRMAWIVSFTVSATVLYFDYFLTPASWRAPALSLLTPGATCDMDKGRYQRQLDAAPVMVWVLIQLQAVTVLFFLLSFLADSARIMDVFWYLTGLIMIMAIGIYMVLMWALLHTCLGRDMVYQNITSYGAFVLTSAFAIMLFIVMTILPAIFFGLLKCAGLEAWMNNAFIYGTFAHSLYRGNMLDNSAGSSKDTDDAPSVREVAPSEDLEDVSENVPGRVYYTDDVDIGYGRGYIRTPEGVRQVRPGDYDRNKY